MLHLELFCKWFQIIIIDLSYLLIYSSLYNFQCVKERINYSRNSKAVVEIISTLSKPIIIVFIVSRRDLVFNSNFHQFNNIDRKSSSFLSENDQTNDECELKVIDNPDGLFKHRLSHHTENIVYIIARR